MDTRDLARFPPPFHWELPEGTEAFCVDPGSRRPLQETKCLVTSAEPISLCALDKQTLLLYK